MTEPVHIETTWKWSSRTIDSLGSLIALEVWCDEPMDGEPFVVELTTKTKDGEEYEAEANLSLSDVRSLIRFLSVAIGDV